MKVKPAESQIRAAADFIIGRAGCAEMAAYYADVLERLVACDTTPSGDVAEMARREAACFDVVTGELTRWMPEGGAIERVPIRPEIRKHPYFTRIHHTVSAARPDGLSPSEAYANRFNVFAIMPGRPDSGPGMIYNAHIDTVAPHIPPRREGRRICGRGACDDKGSVALLIAQLRLLAETERETGIRITAPRVYQFVIEEETGGNGSLSAALDPRFNGFQALVHECAGNTPHPANRGAVWYKLVLRRNGQQVDLVRAAAETVLAMEAEGRLIKSESAHPLFKPHHVQTCHGIIGPFGRHPSSVNDFVALRISGLGRAGLESAVGKAVAEYCAEYGDKTRETDPKTGLPKVPAHWEIEDADGDLLLKVHGKAGHMGAIHLCDCAIIKSAFIIRGVHASGGCGVRVHLDGTSPDVEELVLEGGQGFVPTHGIEEIMRRQSRAARGSVESFCRRGGVAFATEMAVVTFDKLHNNAYASPVDCPLMRAMESAFRLTGKSWPKVCGWDVSCDARIFAGEGRDTVVFGPGALALAHSDGECINLDEACEALAIDTVAAFLLGTGAVS